MAKYAVAATRIVVAGLALMTAGCTPILSVSDAVRMEGVPTLLSAYAEHQSLPGFWHPARGVEVDFLVDGKKLGSAVTDADGYAALRVPIPRGAERFTAEAAIWGQELEHEGIVYHWPADRTILVVDIDGTISCTDYVELFLNESNKGTVPIEGAAETLRELSCRFNIGYLSARPRVLLALTKQWLSHYKFPPGPVITASTIDEGLEAERFKTKAIREHRKHFWQILIGIGDLDSDSEAYASAGLLPLIRHKHDDKEFRSHAIVLGDYAAIRKFFAANAKVLEDPARLQHALRTRQMLLQAPFPYHPRR